jgi:quinoprotein glucose dehydrogenase
MPAGQTGTPMTYALNGKQYIVVAIGSNRYGAEFVAYALPANQPAARPGPAQEQ